MGRWTVSSYCSGGECVGVAVGTDGVAVVDTKEPSKAPLHFTPAEWAAFVAGVKNGEFDVDAVRPSERPGPERDLSASRG